MILLVKRLRLFMYIASNRLHRNPHFTAWLLQPPHRRFPVAPLRLNVETAETQREKA